MGKTAFLFPGQGAQYIGMGKEFYDAFPVCREVFDKAGKAAGLDVAALCFEENESINITEYTQIAMVAAEAAILKAVEETGVRADVSAGLSLGEYTALLTAGVMGMEDVFSIVRKRGIYMQEAVPTGGAMAAVLGLTADVIEKVCEETEGIVSIANYNCPGQIVITGEEKAVQRAAEGLLQSGAKRCVPLKVSGPFHSRMMEGAGNKLYEALAGVKISPPAVPYLSNVTADYVRADEEEAAFEEKVKTLLKKQVSSPVKWQQTIERMLWDGVTDFVEIGPGKTLSGFMRKINKEARVINIEKPEELKKLADLGGKVC